MKPVYTEAANLARQNREFVLATVVNTKGSTPQKPGATLLVRADGSTVGTLGGGSVVPPASSGRSPSAHPTA